MTGLHFLCYRTRDATGHVCSLPDRYRVKPLSACSETPDRRTRHAVQMCDLCGCLNRYPHGLRVFACSQLTCELSDPASASSPTTETETKPQQRKRPGRRAHGSNLGLGMGHSLPRRSQPTGRSQARVSTNSSRCYTEELSPGVGGH